MSKKEEVQSGWPDFYASKAEKDKTSTGLRVCKAAHAEWNGSEKTSGPERIERMKLEAEYRHGRQSGQAYVDNMGLGAGSQNNLSFQIIGIVPRIINEIIGQMGKKEAKIFAKGIDKFSKDARDSFRKAAIKRMKIAEIQQMAKAAGLPAEGDVAPFEDVDDLDIYMEMDFKEASETVAQTGVQWVMLDNDIDELRDKLTDYAATHGKLFTKTELIPNYGIKIRVCTPKNVFYSYSSDNKMSGVKYMGEYLQVSYSDLKAMVGPGSNINTEEDWEEIKRKASRYETIDKHANQGRESVGHADAAGTDAFTCVVQDIEVVFPMIKSVAITKKPDGLVSVHDRADTWEPKKSKSQRYSKDYQTVYRGKWVVGTDYILEWQEKPLRLVPYAPNMSECLLSYSGYITENEDNQNRSLVWRMKPHVDQMQLAIMQMQRILTKTPPVEFVVNVDALRNVILRKGEGPAYPDDLVKEFIREGILYVSMKDAAGNPTSGQPFQLNSSDLSSKLRGPVELFSFHKSQLLDIIGRPDFQPSDKTPVGTQEIQHASYSNATAFLQKGLVHVLQETARKAYIYLQDMAMFYPELIDEAIGRGARITLESVQQTTLRNLGIFYHMRGDDRNQMFLEQNIQTAIDRKIITPSQAAKAREHDDPRAALKYLEKMEERAAKRAQEAEMQRMQQEAAIKQQEAEAELQRLQQKTQIELSAKEQEAAIEEAKSINILREEYRLKKELEEVKANAAKELKEVADQTEIGKKSFEQDRMDARNRETKDLEVKADKAKKGQGPLPSESMESDTLFQ